MRSLLMSGLMLALAGCGGAEVADNKTVPTPTPTPGPKLGGVELNKPVRASGAAPYWTLYIAPGTIAFADAADAPVTDFYPVSPTLKGDTARLDTQTPTGEPVTITLAAKACAAGKAQLPLTAEMRIGARTLRGCAANGTYDWAARKPSPAPDASGDNASAAAGNARR
ncbi:hypothetical protein Q9Q95_11535 [Sphingomonas sp. DG1-23]|uniref:hypothetical protein n=1 Tax=Sphingomonas sp. DG1-23 TaxID=3068316 RepID=UPI00273E92F4|nr:hypothetical protein [Sphingomonas sp. DG1-23]MDP5279554.1 hypothetical protein [Sphingomonas sp. DG1-23]